jgi:hypothetical protein
MLFPSTPPPPKKKIQIGLSARVYLGSRRGKRNRKEQENWLFWRKHSGIGENKAQKSSLAYLGEKCYFAGGVILGLKIAFSRVIFKKIRYR